MPDLILMLTRSREWPSSIILIKRQHDREVRWSRYLAFLNAWLQLKSNRLGWRVKSLGPVLWLLLNLFHSLSVQDSHRPQGFSVTVRTLYNCFLQEAGAAKTQSLKTWVNWVEFQFTHLPQTWRQEYSSVLNKNQHRNSSFARIPWM